MPESEPYWKRHLPGIIQCILALYCAAIATLERYRPRGIPVSSETTGRQVSVPLVAHYSMPIWLWLGIVGLALSVFVPAMVGIFRRRKAHNQQAILSSLQANTLALSREIRAFLHEINPPPKFPEAEPIKAGENVTTWTARITAETDAWNVAYGQWVRKRLYGYQQRYLARVKGIANEIGAKSGMVVAPLMEYVNDPEPLIDFDALPDILSGFVAKLEKPEERLRFEQERKMQQTRALIANTPTGPPKVESPQELRDRTIAVLGGLYAFLIDMDLNPCQPREHSYTGLESYPDDARIKGAFPVRFRDHLSVIEDGAKRYGFWNVISFSFAGSRESVSTLQGDAGNANDVHSLIDTLINLARAIESKHKGRGN